MFKKFALLAAALTLTLPAFAQGTAATPGATPPAASSDAKPVKKHTKKHHKKVTTNTDSTAPK